MKLILKNLAIYFTSTLLRSWVISQIWVWYFEPVTGVQVSLLTAVGLTLLMALLFPPKAKDKHKTVFSRNDLLGIFVMPCVGYFLAWFWQLWV